MKCFDEKFLCRRDSGGVEVLESKNLNSGILEVLVSRKNYVRSTIWEVKNEEQKHEFNGSGDLEELVSEKKLREINDLGSLEVLGRK